MSDKKSACVPFPSMFSAASFFDVLESTQHQGAIDDSNESRPKVVAFYGFRGGAGRTLALAHTASLLARRGTGLHLAVIDLDLEAPGIHIPLRADISSLSDAQGIVPLLRSAMAGNSKTPLAVADSLLMPGIATGGGRLSVLPAGHIGRKYLAQLEELNVALWHSYTPPQPLQAVFSELSRQLKLDGILVDCRTGFNGLSASVLFHIADAIVLFLPITAQVWDGFTLLLEALRAARARRSNAPALLVVPSMVPAGEAGRQILAPFAQEVRRRYQQALGGAAQATDDDVLFPEEERVVLDGGLPYDIRVAISGTVDKSSESSYSTLADAVADLLGAEFVAGVGQDVDVAGVIDQLKDIDSPFAEDATVKTLLDHFVRPSDMSAIVHPDTLLIIGAKGAGKTWMWRYLVHEQAASNGPRFIPGHAPHVSAKEAGAFQLSRSALREIEKASGMSRRNTYGAFWRMYAIARVLNAEGVRETLRREGRTREEKRILTEFSKAEDVNALQASLERWLRLDGAGTLAENAIAAVDAQLRRNGEIAIACYDGLDTDFEGRNFNESARRRQAFVGGLLEMILESRSRLLNMKFKVFLREDIWSEVTIQNRSHFGAALVELKWRPEDLWRIALDQLTESAKYLSLVERIQPGISKPWPVDNETLEALLAPFWGRTVEGRKGTGKARTARYVQNRILDAKGRVFPRTMLQILVSAVAEQRKRPQTPGRVVSFASLRAALETASEQRVEDLTKEYAYLQPYLQAMRGMNAIATREEITAYIRGQMKRPKQGRRGVLAGALHAGPGGWTKVVQRLEEVGVFGPYERERDTGRLAVAMLYRSGLNVRSAGLH